MSSSTGRTHILRQSRPAVRRRRLTLLLVVAVAVAAIVAFAPIGDVVRKVTLPLQHEDIIRQQAREKQLDPALIAAIIYEESKFRDQTSQAGARGLMQITPGTAEFIARDSGGTAFVQGDLATPQVNISYGSYYLRYLMRRYEDERLAVAAYNAGETNLDRWIEQAGGREAFDPTSDIPFPETHQYLTNVLERREEYRRHYGDELGL